MAENNSPDLELPDRILNVFRQGEYAQQGRKQTDIICESVNRDLIVESEVLADAAQQGELVAERNYTPSGHQFYRDIDYVIGTPLNPPQRGLLPQDTFSTGSVDDVWFALDSESLVSSVSNNWKNRGTAIHSFYLTVYDISPVAVTAGIIVLNVSDLDRNPQELIEGYREFDFANGSLAQSLDLLSIIPIKYNSESSQETKLASDLIDFADELHYSSFIQTLATAIEKRFQGEYQVSPDSVESVISHQESDVLEFKEELPEHVDDLAKEVAALANHEGGTILLGVDDEGNPVGLEDVKSVEERASGVLSNRFTDVIQDVQKARVEGSDILIINVNRAMSALVDVEGTFYIRRGTTRDRLSGHEIIDRFPR